MATIKSYTDLSQSKTLSKILPLESADNVIVSFGSREGTKTVVMPKETLDVIRTPFADIREITMCWSLAALLDIVKTYSSRLEIALRADKKYNVFAVSGDFAFRSFDECSEGYNNPIDACYNLILKLNELKML